MKYLNTFDFITNETIKNKKGRQLLHLIYDILILEIAIIMIISIIKGWV